MELEQKVSSLMMCCNTNTSDGSATAYTDLHKNGIENFLNHKNEVCGFRCFRISNRTQGFKIIHVQTAYLKLY